MGKGHSPNKDTTDGDAHRRLKDFLSNFPISKDLNVGLGFETKLFKLHGDFLETQAWGFFTWSFTVSTSGINSPQAFCF